MCDDAATAIGAVIQPPIAATIDPGRYIDTVGQQPENRCQQALPQGKFKRAKKVQADPALQRSIAEQTESFAAVISQLQLMFSL